MEKDKITFIEDCLERKLCKYEITLLESFEKASAENKRNFGFMIARGRSQLNVSMLLLAHGLYEECRLETIK